MMIGTPWHAVHATYLSRGVQMLTKDPTKKNGPRSSVCQVAVWSPRTTVRLNAESTEPLVACPKCGETRLIERLDERGWFCGVCAHSWRTGAGNDVGKSKTLRRPGNVDPL